MPVFVPPLAGGLGNILFQLAGCFGISKLHRGSVSINLNRNHKTHHSSTNYFDSLLSYWKRFHRIRQPTLFVGETNLHPIIIPNHTQTDIIGLDGYLQNYSYFWNVRDEFIKTLRFPNIDISKKYPRLSESAFIHVRGGDFLNIPLHTIDLSKYYPAAIQKIQAPHYYIFTNDEEYLNEQAWLKTIDYTIVRENEVDSLYLMSQCQRGAICANSTFSWWGAFLNIKRPIVMPSKWFADDLHYIQGYFFPGVTVLEV